ncbi:hypothetical protein SBRCBS47491_004175 [Sporothrix bragantina]|uniref:Mucin-7 n=1 Tax=Sporothrix bragantina TaxID=671064 RepID=A0ABP0BLK4_9PEZI
MSQVKNLRAMFEQRGDSSPPDRGRVQQGLPAQPADSPRPLSRVRTSFVTVEKDGRVGLQRDTSSDSIPTLSRTISAGTDSDIAVPAAVPQEKSESPAKVDDAKLPAGSQTPNRVPAPIPEEATPVTPTKTSAPSASPSKTAQEATPKPVLPPAAEVKVSAPTPTRNNVNTPGRLSPSKTLDSKAAQRDKSPTPSPRKLFAKPQGSAENQSTPGTPKKTLGVPLASEPKKAAEAATNGNATAITSKPEPSVATASSNGVTNGAAKDIEAATTTTKPAASSSIPMRPKVASSTTGGKDTHKTTSATKTLPKAISTTKANTKPATKSPGLAVKTPTVKTPKTPTSPAKSTMTKTSTKPADRKTTAAKTTSSTAPKTTAAKSSTTVTSSTSTKAKPAPIATFPSNGIGFVKPKPKSPTRPVQLPSSLTTHTASSATKANVPRQSLSRQSGNFLTLHPPSGAARSPSRTSVSTVGTVSGGAGSGVTGGKTLRRQSSTVSRPRPSIGPPPKQTARDHPVTKREKEVDEGFLARMMRPTQASALKTADKTAHPSSSPPRKQPTSTTTTTRKGIAPRSSLPAPVKKAAATAKPLSLPPRPPACITRNPAFPDPAVPVEEKVANPYKPVEAAKEEKAAPEVEVPELVMEETAAEAADEPLEEHVEEPIEEPVDEAAEDPIEEAAEEAAEEPVEEPIEETEEETAKEEGTKDVTEEAVAEVPVEEEEEEAHEEPVDEPAEESVAEEVAEPVSEETASEKLVHPVLSVKNKEEAEVEKSEALVVEDEEEEL